MSQTICMILNAVTGSVAASLVWGPGSGVVIFNLSALFINGIVSLKARDE